MVIQVHMHGRYDLVGVVVLHLVQATCQVAGVMVVNHGERPDDLLVGRSHLLLGNRGANQVAYSLGAVGHVAAARDLLVKAAQQVVGRGDRKTDQP